MNLLIDACVPKSIASDLAALGHDVECVLDWPHNPSDEEVLSAAHRAGRVLITLDKDFGELAILAGHAHAGVLRLIDMPLHRQSVVCRTVLDTYARELQAGALIVATSTRVRIRTGKTG